MKLVGYIVEQKNILCQGTDREHEEWIPFSRKIYKTEEIAADAYKQSPYKNWEGYNVAGRTIPVYRNDNEISII